MRRVLCSTFLFFLLATPVLADFSDFYNSITTSNDQLDPNAGLTTLPILLMPSGGKNQGMGTAYTAVADDASFLEANPSASSLLAFTELTFSHNNAISDTNMEGVVYTMRFNDLGIGFGGKFLYTPFTGYDTWGNRESKGYYSESVGILNLSYNFFSSYYFYGIAVGTNIKVAYRYVPEDIRPAQSNLAVMGDIGVLTRFNFLKPFSSRTKNFSVGAVVKNLGPDVPIGPSETKDPLPTEATFGIAYSPLRPVTLSFDFTLPFSFQPDLYPAAEWSIASGLDIVFTSFFSMQSGFEYRGNNPRISLGSVINLQKIRFVITYIADLTTSSETLDNFSIQAQLKLGDRGRAARQAKIDEYYTAGLEAYAAGKLSDAIDYWDKLLELDPHFQPALEMKKTAQRALQLQQEMESIQKIE